MGAALGDLLAFWILCRAVIALPRANEPDFQEKEIDDDMSDSHDASTALKQAERISEMRVIGSRYKMCLP
jgi:hypothetical protein